MDDADAGLRSPSRWVSPSAWGDYECCPRRYWHGYVDQTPPDRPTWAGWRFGRAVHTALEAAYRHVQGTPRPVGDPASLQAAALALDRAAHDDALGPAQFADAHEMVRGSLQACPVQGHQVLEVEAWLRGPAVHGLGVTGRADLVLTYDDGSIEVCDHKISRRATSAEELAGDRQLLLYAWMAQRRWPHATGLVVSHHYPPLRRTVRVPVDRRCMAQVVSDLADAAATMACDQDFLPVPGPHCRTCRWVAQCPAAPDAAGDTTSR